MLSDGNMSMSDMYYWSNSLYETKEGDDLDQLRLKSRITQSFE